ncbi:MAG: amidohydrolase family protein, partial [Candidatus Binatia bacterium]
METSMKQGYISADSHVVEPADLWLTRMDKRFRDRAPRVESDAKADYYVIEGLPPMPHSGMEGAMMEEKIAKGKIEKLMGRRHSQTRPGAWEPQARLADQKLDNIRAEIVYPGIFGLQFSLAPDSEYQWACIRVYNDWLSELCATAPDHFLGAGLIPISGPVENAIAEAQRVARLPGMRSLMLPQAVPQRPYWSPEYEPLWT